MTRQATVRVYADWDTGYVWDGAYHRWGSVDQHLPVGYNNTFTNGYQPIIRFPIDFSYMESIVSANVVVQVTSAPIHFGSRWGSTPSWLVGRLSSAPPDHQNAALVCGGGGWATGVAPTSPGWDSISTWASHNNDWAYGIDATVSVQALKAGYPNYGLMFAAYNVNLHRSEWWSNNTGAPPYIDITYVVPNVAPTKPWGEAPANASYGNNTTPLVRLANGGDVDGDPAGGTAIEYGVVNNYGDQSWGAGPGASGFDTNPARYVADFYPTLTRGKWHCFRGYFWDHHGASSGYSDPWWHYVWALPNAPGIVGGMQPIHNLSDLNQWSGAEARPTVRITPSDPDGNNQTRINIQVSTDTSSADLWDSGYDGTYANGTAYNFNLPVGLANDQPRYIRAQTRDSQGNWGPWSSWVTIKVRWSQAIYQFNGGTASGQYAYYMGSLSGGSDRQATAIFRGATGAGGVGADPTWKATIGAVGQPEWLNILVRLAVGRDTSAPTALTDMSITFLGAAQQPDEWTFSGFDSDFWQLDTGRRRYGTKALKWTRQTAVANGLLATANTYFNGSPYVVPVVPETEYTLSVWVQGTLSHGDIRGFVLREDTPTPFVVALTDPVTDTQGEWTRMRVTFTTDSSTTSVSIGVQYRATADGLGDIFWVDAVQIEEGPVASVWNPGQTGAVIVDVGGIGIDASAGASLRLRGADGGLFDTVELAAKGLKFGDEWEVYSDGTNLYASNGVTTYPLAPTVGDISGRVTLSAAGLGSNTWNTVAPSGSPAQIKGLTWQDKNGWGWGFTIQKAGYYATTISAVLQSTTTWLIYAVKRNNSPGKHDGQSWVPWQQSASIDWYDVGDHLTVGCYLTGGAGPWTLDAGGHFTVVGIGSGPAGAAGAPGAPGADGADGETIINNIDPTTRSVGARVAQTAATALAASTWAALVWGKTYHDTDGFWTSALPTRFTVPANAPSGVYLCTGTVRFTSAATAGADQFAHWRKNGEGTSGQGIGRNAKAEADGGSSSGITPTSEFWLSPGDFVEIWAMSTAACDLGVGASENTATCDASIAYLGSGSAAGTAVEGTEVTLSTAQSIAGLGNIASIAFNTEVRDQADLWQVSPNPSRVTVKETGWYKVSGGGYWGGATTDWSQREIFLQVGATYTNEATQDGYATIGKFLYQSVSDTFYLTAGQYVQLRVMNSDSVSKDFTGAFLRLVKMAAGADTTYQAPVIQDAPGCDVHATAQQTGIASGVNTAITFSTEDHDSHGFWDSGASSRFTIPAGHAGRYRFVAMGHAEAVNAAISAELIIRKNGSIYLANGRRNEAATAVGPIHLTEWEGNLAVGDYIEAVYKQESGSSKYFGWAAAPYWAQAHLTRLATGPQGEKGDPGTDVFAEGTSFPTSPTVGQRFRRTDIRGGMLFFWDGTYWLSDQLFTLDVGWKGQVAGGSVPSVAYYGVDTAGFAGIYFESLSGEAYRSVNTNDFDLSVQWGGYGTQVIGTSTTEFVGAGGVGWTLRNETISTRYRAITVERSHIEVATTWAGTGTGIHVWSMMLAYRLRAT